MSWNKPSSDSQSVARKAPKASPSLVRGVVAGLVVAVLGIAAFFVFNGKSAKPKVEKSVKKPAQIEEVKPVIQRDISDKVTNVVSEGNCVKTLVQTGSVRAARSASDGVVETLRDGTVVTNKPRVIFKRDLERALMVALRPAGMTGSIFRLLRMRHSDEQILEMMKEMTIPDPGDPEDIRRVKENVQALKEEILSAVKDGESLKSILNELQNRGAIVNRARVNAYKLRAEAQKMGDPELVSEVVRRQNVELKKNGLPPMADPNRGNLTEE